MKCNLSTKYGKVIVTIVLVIAIMTFLFYLVLESKRVQASENITPNEVASTPTSTPYYEDTPTLYISFLEGAPSSKFTFTGLNFPGYEDVTVIVNSQTITTMQASPGQTNWFIFHLDTIQANEGVYNVSTQTESVTRSKFFVLDSNEPVRDPLTGPVFDDSPEFMVPSDIAYTNQAFLPFVNR